MKFRLLISLLIFVFNISHAQPGPQVVVSIKPIHSIVESLMDGINSPELLLESNHSAHTFHLKPSQIKMIETADLVISIGDEFEIGLRKALKNLDQSKRFDIISLEGQEFMDTELIRFMKKIFKRKVMSLQLKICTYGLI